jgi:hypothetical protein
VVDEMLKRADDLITNERELLAQVIGRYK